MSSRQTYGESQGTVKGRPTGNIHPIFQRITEDELSLSLKIITAEVGRRPATLSQKEIQELTGKGRSTVSSWITTGSLPAVHLIQIAHRCAELGDFLLVETIVPSNYTLAPLEHGELNESIDDEIADEVEWLGRARTAFEKKDYKAARRYAQSAKRALATLEAEIIAKVR